MYEKQIKQLIGKGEVQEAFSSFERFVRLSQEAQQELTLIRSRYEALMDQQRADIAGQEHKSEENRIIYRFLELLTKFRKEVLAEYFDVDDIEQYLNKFTSRDQLIEKTLELRLRNKQYQAREKMAEGSSSAIYSLHNLFTNRHAVGLVLKIAALRDTEKRKIQQLLELRHRNVIRLLDHELDIYPFLIIMDYVHGPTLAEALEKTGPRPVAQAADWLYQIIDVTDYLRQKRLLQTNLRPSKIFIDDEWQIMVSPLDLYLNITDRHTYHRYLDICRYGSPESLHHAGENDEVLPAGSSDQYSIGLIAYKILTGEDLFDGNNIYQILAKRRRFAGDLDWRRDQLDRLPQDTFLRPDGSTCTLSSVVERLLHENPADRYRSLHELLREMHLLTRAENPDASLARRSYRRCLSMNREFIRDFYHAFYLRLPEAIPEFSADSRNKQSTMLQMAIDILLDIDQKKELLGSLACNSRHARYDPHYYQVFLDTLVETLEHNDHQWDEAIAAEWTRIREQVMKIIDEVPVSGM